MIIRPGMFLTSTIGTGEGNASLADRLLGTETDGFAINFIDMSMRVRDTSTPANNYSGTPTAKILGTTLRRDGTGLLAVDTDNYYLPTSVFPYSSTQCTMISRCASATNSFKVAAALNFDGFFSPGPGAMIRINSTTQVAGGGNGSTATQAVSPALTANEKINVGTALHRTGTVQSVTARGNAASSNATLDWTGTSNRLQIGALTAVGGQHLNGAVEWILYVPRYDVALLASKTA